MIEEKQIELRELREIVKDLSDIPTTPDWIVKGYEMKANILESQIARIEKQNTKKEPSEKHVNNWSEILTPQEKKAWSEI
jgi:hypothetical protein